MIPLEGGAEISAGLHHHHQSGQELPEEADGPMNHSMHLQDDEAAVAVQGAIGFMKI